MMLEVGYEEAAGKMSWGGASKQRKAAFSKVWV
jgi:hypothetical protein